MLDRPLNQSDRRDRGIAKALQNGDTYITKMIGVAIAKRVWPEDSPEWKAAAEDRVKIVRQTV
jgi:hypothetical protein